MAKPETFEEITGMTSNEIDEKYAEVESPLPDLPKEGVLAFLEECEKRVKRMLHDMNLPTDVDELGETLHGMRGKMDKFKKDPNHLRYILESTRALRSSLSENLIWDASFYALRIGQAVSEYTSPILKQGIKYSKGQADRRRDRRDPVIVKRNDEWYAEYRVSNLGKSAWAKYKEKQRGVTESWETIRKIISGYEKAEKLSPQ